MHQEITTRLALSALASAALMVPIVAEAAPADEIAKAVQNGEVVDLTVTIAENYPAHWPFHPPFKRWVMNWYRRSPGPYAGNPREAPGGPRTRSKATSSRARSPTTASSTSSTTTPGRRSTTRRTSSRRPTAAWSSPTRHGWETGDKYPPERMMGPAVVIDIRAMLDKPNPATAP